MDYATWLFGWTKPCARHSIRILLDEERPTIFQDIIFHLNYCFSELNRTT